MASRLLVRYKGNEKAETVPWSSGGAYSGVNPCRNWRDPHFTCFNSIPACKAARLAVLVSLGCLLQTSSGSSQLRSCPRLTEAQDFRVSLQGLHITGFEPL